MALKILDVYKLPANSTEHELEHYVDVLVELDPQPIHSFHKHTQEELAKHPYLIIKNKRARVQRMRIEKVNKIVNAQVKRARVLS